MERQTIVTECQHQVLKQSTNHLKSVWNPYMSRLLTKPTNWHVRPAKTKISLGIPPVWSVFAVRMKKAWVLSYPFSAQPRLWSDWADARADLSHSLGVQSFCWFCHEAAHSLISIVYIDACNKRSQMKSSAILMESFVILQQTLFKISAE